jgi:hypothetical protein
MHAPFTLPPEHLALLATFAAHPNASRTRGWLAFHATLRTTLADLSATLDDTCEDMGIDIVEAITISPHGGEEEEEEEEEEQMRRTTFLRRPVEGMVRAMRGEWDATMVGGCTSRIQLTHKLESTWFQPSNLKCDILVSIQAFAFKFNLYRLHRGEPPRAHRVRGWLSL